MREHQITITLQAEQFQEIQRLARTAGARSIGTFAREKLLAALDLNLGSKNLKPTRAQDLTSVTGELRRLHRELQIFIAESLSSKDYGYVVNGAAAAESIPGTTVDTTKVESNQKSTSPENKPSTAPQDYGQSAKEIEELAERAFIISPRLGAIEEVSDEPMSFSDPLDELLGEFDESETPVVASNLLNSLNAEQHPQSFNQNEETGEDPHSILDAELAAFQKHRQELQELKKMENKANTTEVKEEPAAPVSANSSAADEEVQSAPAKSDDHVSTDVSAGTQEEGSDVDFQNRPPLSGGPPPRKRRT